MEAGDDDDPMEGRGEDRATKGEETDGAGDLGEEGGERASRISNERGGQNTVGRHEEGLSELGESGRESQAANPGQNSADTG